MEDFPVPWKQLARVALPWISWQKLTQLWSKRKKRLLLKLASKLGHIKEESKTQSRTLPQKTKWKRTNNYIKLSFCYHYGLSRVTTSVCHILLMFAYMHMWRLEFCESCSCRWQPEESMDSVELTIQTVVNPYSMYILGTKHKYSQRLGCVLREWVVSPVPKVYFKSYHNKN